MPRVTVYDMAGQAVGEIDLNERVFGAEVNEALLHQAVVMYQANRRQGSASSLTRDEVRGGGRKPWRQKGTGHARHGTIRSPLWRGGGVTFGPKPRSFRQALPKKARRQALMSALSSKVRDGELIVVDRLEIEEARTRFMARALEALGAVGTTLIVTLSYDKSVDLATRNIPGVLAMPASVLNAYEVLAHKRLVCSKDAISAVEEALGA